MDKHKQSSLSFKPVLKLAVACFLSPFFAAPGLYAAGSFWWSCRGPGGAYTASVAVDPQNPKVIYVGTYMGAPGNGAMGGVYKSTDSGATWTATKLAVNNTVTVLAIDPQNPVAVYAGSDDSGLYKSIDGGENWTAINSGLVYQNITALAVDPHNPAIIYSIAGGLFRSTDGGENWGALNSGLTSAEALVIDPQNPEILYAGMGGRIFKSTDRGASWTAMNNGLHANSVQAFAIDPKNPATIYAATMALQPRIGSTIYRSTDGGGLWIPVYTVFASDNLATFEGIGALAIDPQNPSTLYAVSNNGIIKSTDGGGNWALAAGGIGSIRGLAVDPQNPGTIFAATWNRGILKTTDGGGTWDTANNGLTGTVVMTLAIDRQNGTTIYAGSNLGGVQKSTDGGGTWSTGNSVPMMPVQALAIDPQNAAIVYAGTEYSGVYKSIDGGNNWSPANSGLVNTDIGTLAINPQNPLTLYAANWGGGISKTTDGGDNWKSVNNGLTSIYVLALEIDPRNPSTIYAATNDKGIFKSTDGGTNWFALNTGFTDLHFGALAIDPQNPDTIYAAGSFRLYKSTDSGASWKSSDFGTSINALAVDPQNPDTIYAGIAAGTWGTGVYRSTDGGATWSALGSGLGDLSVMSLAIDPTRHKLYAGTYGNGAWVYSLGCPPLELPTGGIAGCQTTGRDVLTRAGYAKLTVNSGATPYGMAVLSFRQSGATVTEVSVPASPPTSSARIFIDYRTQVNAMPTRSDAGIISVNTGIAVVNLGSETANVTYTLRDSAGASLTIGHGTIKVGIHVACFVNEIKERLAADFALPDGFATEIQFGSLDIVADQPLSILALRGTTNQNNDFLITTTPIADLTQPLRTSSVYFPQFANGGGYTTSLILLNTSNIRETGKLEIRDKDGNPLNVNQFGGTSDSSFNYSIEPGSFFRFQSDGFPSDTNTGWVRLTPDAGTPTPVGSGVFSYNPNDVLVSESGIPAANATTHARVYVDLSRNHNTGLAIANTLNTGSNITINVYQNDGVTAAGIGNKPVPLAANGYTAAFADEFVSGLPAEFTGVLDITSSAPFAAITLRSLVNERNEFLMTAFPVADANQPAPSPIVFPQIADGGGYVTEIILISAGQAASATINSYDENGATTAFGE